MCDSTLSLYGPSERVWRKILEEGNSPALFLHEYDLAWHEEDTKKEIAYVARLSVLHTARGLSKAERDDVDSLLNGIDMGLESILRVCLELLDEIAREYSNEIVENLRRQGDELDKIKQASGVNTALVREGVLTDGADAIVEENDIDATDKTDRSRKEISEKFIYIGAALPYADGQ